MEIIGQILRTYSRVSHKKSTSCCKPRHTLNLLHLPRDTLMSNFRLLSLSEGDAQQASSFGQNSKIAHFGLFGQQCTFLYQSPTAFILCIPTPCLLVYLYATYHKKIICRQMPNNNGDCSSLKANSKQCFMKQIKITQLLTVFKLQ